MDGISDDLKYYLKSMPFSRTTQRISPLSSSSGVALGDSIVFRMPLGSIIDLKTFAIMFDMTPTPAATKFVTYGRGVHNLIRSFQLSVGGNVIISQNNFGRVYSAMNLLTSSADSNNSKALLTYDVNTEAAVVATPGIGQVHSAWLDFPSLNWSTSLIDSSLYGQIEITISLHSSAAEAGVVQSDDTAGSTVALANISAKCDVISTDPMYRQVLQESLNSGANLQVAIPNFFTFESSHNDAGMNSTFTLSSGCIDALLVCPHFATKSVDDGLSGNAMADFDKSPYRTHPAARFNGVRIATLTVDVNGTQVLSNMKNEEFIYHQLTAMGIKGGVAANALAAPVRDNDIAGGFEAGTLADYKAQGYVVPVRFDHGSEPRVLSGIQGSASNGVQFTISTTANAVGSAPTGGYKLLTAVLCKSVLTVSGGGVVSFQA